MSIGLLTRHRRRRIGEGGVVRVDLSDWGAAGAAEVTATRRITSPVSDGISDTDVVSGYSKIEAQ